MECPACQLVIFIFQYEVDVRLFFTDILEPIQLRDRTVYRDLSAHTFHPSEKKALLSLLVPTETDDEVLSMTDLCKRYELCRRTVRGWMERVGNDEFLHNKAGRPNAIDEEGINDIREELKWRRINKNPPDEASMAMVIYKASHATADRRNTLCEDPSHSTMSKVKKEVGATLQIPQIISKARLVACSDPRMSYSVWIMIHSLAKTMPPGLFDQSDRNKKVYSVKLDDNDADRSPLSIVDDESLDIGIMWMFMGSAAGAASSMVLLVAADDLKPDVK